MPKYAGVTRSAPMSNSGSPGGCGNRRPAPAWLLITSPSTSRNCASPSVATMLIGAGALRRRRMTTTSLSAPTPPASTSASGKATQYGTCQRSTRDAEQRGGERPDLAVREVDDAVRPVDEDEADGEDAVGHPGDGAEQRARAS